MIKQHVPESHLDLIDGPYVVALTTVMPDGQPQTTPVWCNRKEEYIYINVMRGFRKEKNMRENPKVCILSYGFGTTTSSRCADNNDARWYAAIKHCVD